MHLEPSSSFMLCTKTTGAQQVFMSSHDLNISTEIPKLQKCLQDLNQCHSETLNYVSGAYGILSLIQGTRDQRDKVRLQKNTKEQPFNALLIDVAGQTYPSGLTGQEYDEAEASDRQRKGWPSVVKNSIENPVTIREDVHGLTQLIEMIKNLLIFGTGIIIGFVCFRLA